MDDLTEQPFSEALGDLLSGEPLPLNTLTRLSDMSDAQLAEFQQAWPAVDQARREDIARLLAEMAEDNFLVDFDPVFHFLFRDAAPTVRISALQGLWDSTNESLIPTVIEMVEGDENVIVRATAARALAHYVLLAEWGQVSRESSDVIVAVLNKQLESRDVSDEVRRASLEAVASTNTPRVTEHILEAYESGSLDMQLSAIYAMGLSADSRWLPILLEEMSHPEAEVREEAARAAGTIGDTSAVSDLAQAAFDEEPEVAAAAILSLGQIGSEEAQDFLNQMLENAERPELLEIIEEALEEMDWQSGALDLLAFEDDDDEPEIFEN